MVETKLIDGKELTEEGCLYQFEKFIWRTVGKFKSAGKSRVVEPVDLYQAGAIGLVKAFRRFDPNKGFTFLTFAAYLINGEIYKFTRDETQPVKFSRKVIELAWKLNKEKHTDLPAEEIAQQYSVSIEFAREAVAYRNSVVSLDAELNDDGEKDVTGHGFVGAEDDTSYIHVEDFITTLDRRDQQIIKLKMDGKNQKAIGDAVGLSQVQISRRLMKIGNKYKSYLDGGEMEMALAITVKEYVSFRKEGYSVAEIAEQFKLQEKQLKSWVYNHREKIDKALESVTIPDSKVQKVLRAKEVSPQLKDNIRKAAEAPGKKVTLLEESAAIADKVGSEVLTFEQIKEKLRRQKNDFEMSETANKKLSEMYHSLKEDYDSQTIKLQKAENKVIELDAKYKENYETAKADWDKQYTEMRDKLLAANEEKQTVINELTVNAEEQARADDEYEKLELILEAVKSEKDYFKNKYDNALQQIEDMKRDIAPIRQLALIKLEADNAQHIQ